MRTDKKNRDSNTRRNSSPFDVHVTIKYKKWEKKKKKLNWQKIRLFMMVCTTIAIHLFNSIHFIFPCIINNKTNVSVQVTNKKIKWYGNDGKWNFVDQFSNCKNWISNWMNWPCDMERLLSAHGKSAIKSVCIAHILQRRRDRKSKKKKK